MQARSDVQDLTGRIFAAHADNSRILEADKPADFNKKVPVLSRLQARMHKLLFCHKHCEGDQCHHCTVSGVSRVPKYIVKQILPESD